MLALVREGVSACNSELAVYQAADEATSLLFGEKVFKLQQILVSFCRLAEGVFKAAWHKTQRGEAVLAPCCVMQSDVLQTIIKCITGWFALEGTLKII